MDEGGKTVDDMMSEDSDVRERGGEWGHLYGPESCTGCQGNPFECGCLDVNLESKGARSRRKKRKGSERAGILKDKWGCQASKEAIGEAKWEAGIRINGGIQGPGGRNPRGKGQAVWKNVGEDRERQSRVMAAYRLRAKEDKVAAKKRVGGPRHGSKYVFSQKCYKKSCSN